MHRHSFAAAATAGAALVLSGAIPAAAAPADAAPAAGIYDPVDIYGEIGLRIGNEYHYRDFAAEGVVVGDGPELTGADLTSSDPASCGDLLVDLDPVTSTITISADQEVCEVTSVAVVVRTDEVDVLSLSQDTLLSSAEGVVPTKGVPNLSEESGMVFTWIVNGDPQLMDGKGVWVYTVNDRAAIEDYVVQVYQDLFGREPDPTGLDGWADALQDGTPYSAVAYGITYSDEYRMTLIRSAYQAYLEREPDPAGAAAWLKAMWAGTTIQQIEAGFIASDEYYARAGGSDAQWVKELYLDVLDRPAADAEVKAWTDALAAGGTRHQVAMGFLVSYEHLTDVVDGHYQHLLGRGIDPAGAHSWVIAIQGGTRVEAVIAGIVASDEYKAQAATS